jgi:tetratricopeptide (TPR) repeat protein
MKKLSAKQVQSELEAAREAFSHRDFPTAQRHIEWVLRENPDCAEAYVARGMLLVVIGNQNDALMAFTRSVELEPNRPESLSWAIVTYLKLGLPERAEPLARRLVAIDPAAAGAHYLLGNSLALLSRDEEALAEIETALNIKPLELDYLVAQGQLLEKLHWASLALESYRVAFQHHNTPRVGVEYARGLLESGRTDEAMATLNSVFDRLEPATRPYIMLAQALTESHEFDRAEEFWQLAKKHGSDANMVSTCRIRAEAAAGRLPEAELLLREGLEENPSFTLLYQLFTSLRTINTLDLPVVEKMKSLIAEKNLPPGATINLSYALGKAYNDLGDFEIAMGYFDQAKEAEELLSPSNRKFNRRQWSDYIDSQINFFTKDRFEKVEEMGLDNSVPLFIVGMIRSGTTLSAQILTGHSLVSGGDETPYWSDRRDKIFNAKSCELNPIAGRKYASFYVDHVLREGGMSKYVIDKFPLNVLIAGMIHILLPKAKFIHMERHPVDTLLSIWMTPMKTGLPFITNKENLVFVFREYLRIVAHLKEVLPEATFRSFSYEDLTNSPRQTIDSMLQFLKLESEESCYVPQNSSRTVRTPSAFQVRQPIHTGSNGKWKDYLPWLGSFRDLLGGE